MKIGDEIQCVKLDSGLVLGKKYKVFSYSPTWCEEKRPVIKVQKNGSPYYADHFKLIKELSNMETTNMKIGDKIVCKQDRGSNSLQLNKEYIIVQINSHGNIGLQENFGGKFLLPHFYKPERFSLSSRTEYKAKAQTKNIDLAKKYKTRSGCPVNLFCFSNSAEYPVVGEYQWDGVAWNNESWSLDGRFLNQEGINDLDLVEVKTQEDIKCGYFSVTVFSDGSVYLHDDKGRLNESIDKKTMQKIVDAWQNLVDKE